MNWKETAIKIPNGATEERINCYLLDFQHRHLQSKNYKHPGAAGLLAKTPGRATCALRSMLTRVPTKDINRKRIRAAAVTPRCFSSTKQLHKPSVLLEDDLLLRSQTPKTKNTKPQG